MLAYGRKNSLCRLTVKYELELKLVKLQTGNQAPYTGPRRRISLRCCTIYPEFAPVSFHSDLN